MNFFLQSMEQILDATRYLPDNGLMESGISAKNWEAVQVIPYFRDGNWLDMGSDGGIVLENLKRKNIKGIKVGIDLAYTEVFGNRDGVDYIKGDLMDVPLPDGFFNYITSLSVIEHEVDFGKFAKEVSRLLAKGGELFVSFDFWQPKPIYEKRKLYKLDWNILDAEDVGSLLTELEENGLLITTEIDWTIKDAVINDTYCSPVKDVSYTFGILHFIKK
jgi:2-polyprenyl-3-methyl-5-hydroxy-6-metoxy-1,4-benzoquinol methylase